MKCVTIIGARPQFIKAAPMSAAMINAGLNEALIHTGQHYDYEMSQVFFDELNIPPPKYNLNISGGSHAQMTAKMLRALEEVIIQEEPNFVLVYGDTNSTLSGALAAAKFTLQWFIWKQDFDPSIKKCLKRLIEFLLITFLHFYYVQVKRQLRI